MYKVKMLNEGQPCRKCNTPVIKKTEHKKKIKAKQSYYFKAWLVCPKCGTSYMLESEKVVITNNKLF